MKIKIIKCIAIFNLINICIVHNAFSQIVQDPLKLQGYWEEANMGSISIGWDGKQYVVKFNSDPAVVCKLVNNVLEYSYSNPGLSYNPNLPPNIRGSIVKRSADKIIETSSDSKTKVEYIRRGELDEVTKKVLTSNYSNFDIFFNDFKTTVLKNEAIIILPPLLEEMIKFPFIDFYKRVYNEKGLTCKFSSDFVSNYKKIFNTKVVDALRNDKPEKVNPALLTDAEQKANAMYFLMPAQGDYPCLLFGKVNGRFMLIGLKYFS